MRRAALAALTCLTAVFVAEPAAQTAATPGATIDPAGFTYARQLSGGSGLVEVSLDVAVLAHSRGPSGGFADARILDNSNRQVPYVLSRQPETPLTTEVPITPSPETKSPEVRAIRDHASVYQLTLPFPELPDATLEIDTTAPVFKRDTQVGIERAPDRWHRETWLESFTRRPWFRAEEVAAESTFSVAIPPVDSRYLLLIVYEGDNAPLPISHARLRLPTYVVKFFNPDGAPLRLMYGRDDLSAPQYDLALRRQEMLASHATPLTMSPETTTGVVKEPAKPLVTPLVYWIALAIAVLALLALIVRLVRAQ